MSDQVVSLLVLMAILTGLLLMLAVSLTVQRRHRQQRQLLGLEWLAALRALLTHIQKHRGLCSGFLNGGQQLQSELESMQKLVSRDMADIASVDVSIEKNSRWQGITQHWARLAGNYQSLSIDNCLSQHNHLIKNLLYLIDDLARECDLLLLRNRQDQPLHLYWRELLLAAEYIGQARAIGTGVTSAAWCDSVSRIRLNYLCQQIESNTQRLWREIGSTDGQTSSVTRLIDCINQQVVCETPTIGPAEFFDTATAAIDGLLDQFDQLIMEQKWS